MTELIQFLLRHGYTVLFAVVFIEQAGAPVPSAPILLAAGALAANGSLSFAVIILLALVASLTADLIWYELGRRRGHEVLNYICRLSLEPDSCIRWTQDVFARHGARAILVAKFVPGLNTAAPPMAGLLGIGLFRFVLLDLAAAALWSCTLCLVGFVFSSQIEDIALLFAHLGSWAVILAVFALALFVAGKYVQRRRFMRQLRIARISPEVLAGKLAAGENVVIVDLRHDLEFKKDEVKLPGAIHMTPEEIEHRHLEIPRDREIVLYCT
jgi:membrane protein DedA with SNARE-associated domain